MFQWSTFSKSLTQELARATDLRVSHAIEDLRVTFGEPPGEEFVAQLWPILRDRWLANDPDARAAVVVQLRHAGLGDDSIAIKSKTGQLSYLGSCRNAGRLRTIVYHTFLEAGEATEAPVVIQGQVAPQPTPASPADPGLAAVDALFSGMQIDEPWCVRRPRGFTWWGYRLAQHVEASELFRGPDGEVASTVRIWTEVVRDVPAKDADTAERLCSAANAMQTMNALVYDRERGTIEECSTSTVYEDTVGSWNRMMVFAAVLQVTAAHTRAHAMATAVGGVPAATVHPTSGERPEMDDILNVPANLIAVEGRAPSGYQGDRILSLGTYASELYPTNFDATGLTTDLPYSSNLSAIDAAMSGRHSEPLGTALFQVFTDQPHPECGSGALCILTLPISLKEKEALRLANRLNAIEATGTPLTKLMGAWCATEHGRHSKLAFVTFLPTTVAGGGLLENIFLNSAVRARWAHGVIESVLPTLGPSRSVRAAPETSEPSQPTPATTTELSTAKAERPETARKVSGIDSTGPSRDEGAKMRETTIDERLEVANEAAGSASQAWVVGEGLLAIIGQATTGDDDGDPIAVPDLEGFRTALRDAATESIRSADLVLAQYNGEADLDDEELVSLSTRSVTEALVAERISRELAQLLLGVTSQMGWTDFTSRAERAAVITLTASGTEICDEESVAFRGANRPEMVTEIAGFIGRLLSTPGRGLMVRVAGGEHRTVVLATSPNADLVMSVGDDTERWEAPVTIAEPVQRIVAVLYDELGISHPSDCTVIPVRDDATPPRR